MSKDTSCELIMNFELIEIIILDLCMFSFVINNPSSVEVPCEHAGFLDLFRTREYAQESLDHFDAYLFLYAFTLNH
jgi:hypothetical protein